VGTKPLRADSLILVLRGFSVAMGLPLAVYATVGAFSRYTADDFCWAGVLRTEGFLNANVHWYTIYSPRYTFTFLVNLTELVGPAVVPVLPVTAIAAWLAVLAWTFTQFRVLRLPAFLLAEVGVLATLWSAPDLPQSLYWQTGLLTYLLPLVMATALIGWVCKDLHSWWAYTISASITFLAGGLSETYLVPQNVAITLAVLAALAFRTRRAHLTAALAGGVLALLVIVLAPATASRVAGTPADLWLTLSASIATAYAQAVRLVRYFPFAILLSVGVPTLLGGRNVHVDGRWLLLVTLAVAVTLPFCYFPSFYAQNGNPPARSLIVPGSLLISYLMFLGFWLGGVLPAPIPATRRSLAFAVLALVPIGAAVITLPNTAAAAQYASLFDAEDHQIRASASSGQADLRVPALPPNYGENFVSSDPDDWFNACVARYYGVRSIAAVGSAS
jgi:Family of unknown function (DUF6056)